jgi:hypothetical protein
MMVKLAATKTRLETSGTGNSSQIVRVIATDKTSSLYEFRNEDDSINSTKILNRFKSILANVPNYRNADVKKSMQAVTLELSALDWTFDIVPAIGVRSDGGTLYYLIPNGKGEWTRTDPRIDQKNITDVNARHDGAFLHVLRMLKYWNARRTKPVLPSYYFETLAIKIFQTCPRFSSSQTGVRYFFERVSPLIQAPCPDPKGLGPNLDETLSNEDRKKVLTAVHEVKNAAFVAMIMEFMSAHVSASQQWRRVFGNKFPVCS